MVTLYPPGSPYLKMDRIREPEQYNMSQAVPGRDQQHRQHPQPIDRSAHGGSRHQYGRRRDSGGGRRAQHSERRVSEAADFVPFFYNYGVNTIILRNRLRRDGYNPQTDEVYDALQAIRLVRAMPKNGISIRTRSASWASRRARNWPRRRRFCSTISTRRIAAPAILWRELLRARTSRGSSIPVPRRSPAIVPPRRFRATFLPPSSCAAARTTRFMPFGR